MIAQLGSLAVDAALRGDDRAAGVLHEAIGLIVADGSAAADLAARKAREADRQQRRRDKRHATSRDVTLHHVTAPEVSPDPFLTPEEAKRRDAREAPPDEMTELSTALLAERMQTFWPDADAFVKRRPYRTWSGWLKAMLEGLTGGKALPADVARVCRDDEALTKPVGSPKGFRVFLASAVEERLHGGETRHSNGAVRTEHWSDKKAREERDASERQLAGQRAGNVALRRGKPDGEAWWARMLAEAKAAGEHPTLYAFDRINQPAEVRRASA